MTRRRRCCCCFWIMGRGVQNIFTTARGGLPCLFLLFWNFTERESKRKNTVLRWIILLAKSQRRVWRPTRGPPCRSSFLLRINKLPRGHVVNILWNQTWFFEGGRGVWPFDDALSTESPTATTMYPPDHTESPAVTPTSVSMMHPSSSAMQRYLVTSWILAISLFVDVY